MFYLKFVTLIHETQTAIVLIKISSRDGSIPKLGHNLLLWRNEWVRWEFGSHWHFSDICTAADPFYKCMFIMISCFWMQLCLICTTCTLKQSTNHQFWISRDGHNSCKRLGHRVNMAVKDRWLLRLSSHIWVISEFKLSVLCIIGSKWLKVFFEPMYYALNIPTKNETNLKRLMIVSIDK